MTYRKELAIGLSFILLSFFCFMTHIRNSREAMAAMLAPEILRFHVLANSDSNKDQALKLEVRDAVLQYMQELPSTDLDKDSLCDLLALHLPEIEAAATSYIASAGYHYQAKAELVNCHFPPRTYGDVTLPEGQYDALRITLGKGKGHNWWCVLYPQLCFTDAVTMQISRESEQELQDTAKKSGCILVEDSRPKIRFLIRDLIVP